MALTPEQIERYKSMGFSVPDSGGGQSSSGLTPEQKQRYHKMGFDVPDYKEPEPEPSAIGEFFSKREEVAKNLIPHSEVGLEAPELTPGYVDKLKSMTMQSEGMGHPLGTESKRKPSKYKSLLKPYEPKATLQAEMEQLSQTPRYQQGDAGMRKFIEEDAGQNFEANLKDDILASKADYTDPEYLKALAKSTGATLGEGLYKATGVAMHPARVLAPDTAKGMDDSVLGYLQAVQSEQGKNFPALKKPIVPLVTGDMIRNANDPASKFGTAVMEGAEGLTTPPNVAILGASQGLGALGKFKSLTKMVPAAEKALTGSFLPGMAEGTVAGSKATVEGLASGDYNAAAQGAGQALVSGAMGGLLLKGMMGKPGPKQGPVPEPPAAPKAEFRPLRREYIPQEGPKAYTEATPEIFNMRSEVTRPPAVREYVPEMRGEAFTQVEPEPFGTKRTIYKKSDSAPVAPKIKGLANDVMNAGGISDGALYGEVKHIGSIGEGGYNVLNRSGVSADVMRGRMEELGYGPYPKLNDFIADLKADIRGAKGEHSGGRVSRPGADESAMGAYLDKLREHEQVPENFSLSEQMPYPGKFSAKPDRGIKPMQQPLKVERFVEQYPDQFSARPDVVPSGNSSGERVAGIREPVKTATSKMQSDNILTLLNKAIGGEEGAVSLGKKGVRSEAARNETLEARRQIMAKLTETAKKLGISVEDAAAKLGLSPDQYNKLVTTINSSKPEYNQPSVGTRVRETVQDNMIQLRETQRKAGMKDHEGPYGDYTRMSGRTDARKRDANEQAQKIVNEMTNDAKLTGINRIDIEKATNEYMQAMHAPERNAALGDGAAGMTNAEAAAAMQKIEVSPLRDVVKKHASEIMALHRKTLDLLLSSQVIDRKTYDALKAKYKNHVPLQRIMDEGGVESMLGGRGLDVKSSGLKKAKGSKRQVADILSNVVANLQAAIQNSERNKFGLSVLEFARQNPGLGMFKEVRPKGKDSGQTMFELGSNPRIFQVREQGKPVYLEIADPRLATVVKGLNKENIGPIVRFIEPVTRLWSSMATRFNWEFAASNKLRDLQEMVVSMSGEMGAKKAFKSVARDPASIKAVTEYLRGKDTPNAKLVKQMVMDGGTTGGMSLSTRGEVELNIENMRKLADSNPRKAVHTILKAIDNWNSIFEDSTRFSVYKTALESGLSREHAAYLAKESTLNFNKKGSWGAEINALWMFSNASIQGSAKMLRAMKNPKVAAATSLIVGAAATAVNSHNDQIDPEWRDKVGGFDRAKNLVIVMPNSDGGFAYVKVPVSYALVPLKAMADSLYDVGNSKITPVQAGKHVVGSIMEGYNPLGGNDPMSALTPTILDVPLDISRNQKFSGRPIKPDYDQYQPEHTKYFKSLKKSGTGRVLIDMTQGLSKVGIEISPADIDYALGSYLSGSGKSITRILETASSLMKGEEIEPKNTPIVNRFYNKMEDDEVKAMLLRKRKNEAKKRKSLKKAVREDEKFDSDYDSINQLLFDEGTP